MGPEPIVFGGSDWVLSLAAGEMEGVFWLKSAVSISCALSKRQRRHDLSRIRDSGPAGSDADLSAKQHTLPEQHILSDRIRATAPP